ncbi:hypothetical protein ANN_21708 [Periplaneta americana]|uniref:DUF7869 domain-containing protein n=1 Tax=Periplaneta americana TaxID=6978 RepID=A0ABQ8S679_PERAM|nr:hypothetical protein ANN_21708 [Periplaneta americana]
MCKCKKECQKLSAEHKQQLFLNFYKCKLEQQGTFLLGLMQLGVVKRRRHGQYNDPADSRRQTTVYYTVPDGNGNHVEVCRKTFSEIFALSHKRVQVLQEKKKKGECVYVDARGKHGAPRKYSEDDRKQVCEHIKSFPIEENHYSRERSRKESLSPDLNMSRLFKAFTIRFPGTKVTYNYYADTFKKHFPHLRFGRPKSDTCSTCDLLHAKIKCNPRDTQHNAALELHQRKAKKAMTALHKDKLLSQTPSSDTCMVTVDLQKVLYVPSLTHCEMYYSRQLSCFNLCVHVSDTEDAYMCLWNESVSGRGGNEIVSSLLKVISLLPSNKRKLVIWTDNCIGQNKNKMMVLALVHLVAKGRFDEISHKFLVSGHSFLPCDRDFAMIEKRKRVSKIFVPHDLETLITSSRPKHPYIIVNMEKNDFKDLHKAADNYVNTAKLNISQVSWIKIVKEHPTHVHVKTSFSDIVPWRTYNIIKKGQRPENLSTMELPPLECKSRLTVEKKMI